MMTIAQTPNTPKETHMNKTHQQATIKSIQLPNQVRLQYLEQGQQTGVPVILLHGVTDSWRSFEPMLPHLPQSLRVFALSQRGHGDSDRPETGYRFKDFSDDVLAFLDAQEIAAAVIVGTSMGSSVAQHFAIHHPERTLGLVLMGAFTSYDNVTLKAFYQSTIALLTDPIDPALAREFQLSTLTQPVPPKFLDTVVQESLKVPARVWKDAFAGFFEDTTWKHLGHISAPTLIIWGDQDTFAPRSDQVVLNEVIENSRLSICQGAGHALHWEEPQRVAAELLEFFDQLGRSKTLADLATRLSGTLLTPTSPGYDEARALWNGMIDPKPAAIAKCTNPQDVIHCVNFARERGLPVAVRGGGHNVAGFATIEGGLVIDLSAMRAVTVDPVARTARAQGGATWGDVDAVTQVHGLAAPGGVVSATGIAGLTLGGGMGWLRRKHGLSCDNLVGAEVVTADGRLVRASETENPELLWGLRGGGGNFGIVTAFEYRLHPVGPEVAFTFVFYPLEEAKAVLKAHHDFITSAPNEISTIAVLGRVPHGETFAPELHGTPFVGILGMHAGDPLEGERAIKALRELGTPLVDLSAIMPYREAQTIYDADYPDGHRYYWKSTNLETLSDEVLDILVRFARAAPSDHSTIDIWLNGGAMGRVPADATAYGRRVPYIVNPEANWERPEDDDANITWARDCLKALEPHGLGGAYLNFPGLLEEGERMVKASFGENHARLVELKKQYDPSNFFRRNQNINPNSST